MILFLIAHNEKICVQRQNNLDNNYQNNDNKINDFNSINKNYDPYSPYYSLNNNNYLYQNNNFQSSIIPIPQNNNMDNTIHNTSKKKMSSRDPTS